MGRTKVNIEDVYWGGNDNPTPFVTSIPIPVNGSNEGNLNEVLQVGSYSINGPCYNVPDKECGNNTNSNTTAFPVSGTLNVFMSGNTLFQQLFWTFWEYSVIPPGTRLTLNQYQRVGTLSGSDYVWTDWKKLIKCDDYATDTKIGGIKIGYDSTLSGSPEAFDVRVSNYGDANDGKAFVVIGDDDIKEVLGIEDEFQDIFISGKQTPSDNFNDILTIGSFQVFGGYTNAPNPNCGTNTDTTASMVGTLNVFRSGVDNWKIIQQLFWVKSGVVEQYQRNYYHNGSTTAWTDWKRLIKCDDYATSGRSGIISAANFAELFRDPDLIQLWNAGEELILEGGVYYLNSLVPIDVTIENSIRIDSGVGNNIERLTSERRYRVTYEVQCVKKDGEGEVTIKIENVDSDLYSATEYISDSEVRKRIAFSVIITGTELITPSIEVGSGLVISLYPYHYQINVEEIRFPYFTTVQ